MANYLGHINNDAVQGILLPAILETYRTQGYAVWPVLSSLGKEHFFRLNQLTNKTDKLTIENLAVGLEAVNSLTPGCRYVAEKVNLIPNGACISLSCSLKDLSFRRR